MKLPKNGIPLKPKDAAFFKKACEEMGAHPAVLYSVSKLLNEVGTPFLNEGIYWILSQRGLFTISGEPTLSLENAQNVSIKKFLIPKESKKAIWKTPDFCGINSMSIYQGLDNLS